MNQNEISGRFSSGFSSQFFFSIELLSRDLKELIGERTAAKIPSSSSGPNNRRKKLGRHALTELNLAQLQIILNYLLSRIEELNEKLVEDLIERDELLMEQDSLLTDIEDITKGIQF